MGPTGAGDDGFGFVVASFGLFMPELAAVREVSPQHHSGLSLLVGTTPVMLGVAVNLAAAVKHWYTVRRLERGLPLKFSALSLTMVVALLLRLSGSMTAVYSVVGLDHKEGFIPPQQSEKSSPDHQRAETKITKSLTDRA